jgi:uncharacterized protein DUF4398
MRRAGLRALPLAAALAASCALAPRHFAHLEEARAAAEEAAADPMVTCYARVELRQARETLEQAIAARDTLQDPAVVEHLAYLARQRVAIAREAAALAAAPETGTHAAQSTSRQ